MMKPSVDRHDEMDEEAILAGQTQIKSQQTQIRSELWRITQLLVALRTPEGNTI